MHNSSTYRVGPRGGVYTVDFDGTRHYLDREQARRYIAQLTAKRSRPKEPARSRLVSINPGDREYQANAWAKPPQNFRGVGRCPVLAELEFAPAPLPLWA